jgi:hypothetical protein
MDKLVENFGLKIKELAEIHSQMERELQGGDLNQEEPDPKIELVIGGKSFITLKSTLTKYSSLLANLVTDGKHHGSIFLDRSPKYFNEILDYLRMGAAFQLPASANDLSGLMEEAKFYKIQGLISLGKPFADSFILSEQEADELTKLCGFSSVSRWKLIYRGTRDGFGSADFHRECDQIAPTLTIVLSTQDYIFGGYTSATWNRSGSMKKDKNAFLFSLKNKDNLPCKMGLIVGGLGQGGAISCSSSSGPAFGEGHDLYIENNADQNNDSYANLGCSFIFANYEVESDEAKQFLAGSYFFRVDEIEVYQLIGK